MDIANAHFLGLIANWLKEKAPNLAAWRFLIKIKEDQTASLADRSMADLSFPPYDRLWSSSFLLRHKNTRFRAIIRAYVAI